MKKRKRRSRRRKKTKRNRTRRRRRAKRTRRCGGGKEEKGCHAKTSSNVYADFPTQTPHRSDAHAFLPLSAVHKSIGYTRGGHESAHFGKRSPPVRMSSSHRECASRASPSRPEPPFALNSSEFMKVSTNFILRLNCGTVSLTRKQTNFVDNRRRIWEIAVSWM